MHVLTHFQQKQFLALIMFHFKQHKSV